MQGGEVDQRIKSPHPVVLTGSSDGANVLAFWPQFAGETTAEDFGGRVCRFWPALAGVHACSLQHVLDRSLDVVVCEVHAATLGRHAALAVKRAFHKHV